MINKQRHYNQRPWLKHLRSDAKKFIYLNFYLPTEGPLNSFSQAANITRNSLINLATFDLSSPNADVRSWYNFQGKVSNIFGYISVKENFTDHALISKAEKAFTPFIGCALTKQVSIIQGVPVGNPVLTKGNYPFQFCTLSHSIKQSQEPHIIRMIDGKLVRPIHVFYEK